ncbi:alpha/beta fold hydrolase [Neogemmobacter tilapiae]|uniref:Hydrolase n=1 Tax=Neogemmobacter tilapiae TaxID=875041 RepID=A0A918TSN3_9RHOB|nr:alpha/beta hydrolase [Gemmobacter tilapiae]GHC60164.1 hydrolase [Gemmobacter tilapiae]
MTLVLIPGMMCDARMWGGVDAALNTPIHHHLPTGADTMQDLAAQLLQDAPPRFALAGLSMGGILAMEVLRQAPHRVERLALLDTNPRAETPQVQARREPQIDRALSGDLAGVMTDQMIPHYFAAPSPDHEALCLDMALTLGPNAFQNQSRALRDRPDQQPTLAAFRGPALVLMGEHDRLCPHDRHALMHQLMPQSRFEIIAGAGHIPPLERPQETAEALRHWLALPA